MATNYKTLHQSLLTTTAVTSTYSVPLGLSAVVGSMTFVNVSSVASTLKVWQVPTAATTEADAYVMVQTITIGPGEKFVLAGPKTFGASTTIKVQASVASAINCLIEGAEVGGYTGDAWGSAIGRARRTSTQSLPHGSWQDVTFTTAVLSSGVTASASTVPLAIVTAGNYVVEASVEFAATSATGGRSMKLIHKDVGGTILAVYVAEAPADSFSRGAATIAKTLTMAVGDFVQVQVMQTSGAALNLGTTDGTYVADVSAVRVGYQTNPSAVVPIAGTIDYFGTTEPSDGNWKFPNGQAISRTTYATLFGMIGTTHGVGDGSTTFNLPDMRGRVGAGMDNMGGTTAQNRITGGTTLGGTGGVESALIAFSEIPDHAHQPGNGGMGTGATAGSTPDIPARSSTAGDANFRTGVTLYNSGAYGSTARGAQTALSKLQPYTLVNKLIRVM